jgi:hypothetical protein
MQDEVFGNQEKTLANLWQAQKMWLFALEHTLGRACGITREELEELALQVGIAARGESLLDRPRRIEYTGGMQVREDRSDGDGQA